jgi:hypothetical protein
MNFMDVSGIMLPDLDCIGTLEWKQIAAYPNYYVSNYGHIWNHKLQHLLPGWIRGEYKSVSLMKDGKPKTFTIHSLVARAFIPNPENKPILDHIHGKLDNSVSNLRWATHSENSYNMGKPKSNKTGFKGVSLHKSGKYIVHCNKKHIGTYKTAEEGYAAYCKVAMELHGEFFHP